MRSHFLTLLNSKPAEIKKEKMMADDIVGDQVKVTITDQAGGKTVTAGLPTTVPMRRLLGGIVTQMHLPSNVQYGIQHKQSGKQLQESDTLASAGVKDGDTLRL